MPGLDGTGPMGMGPRTGGGFGYCPPGAGPAPYGGYYGVRGLGRGGLPWGGGRGFGFGGGRGRGRRAWGRGWGYPANAGYGYAPAPYGYGPGYAPPAPPTAEQELQWLRSEAEAIRGSLAEIEQRIAELADRQEQPSED